MLEYCSPISGAGDLNHDGYNDWLIHHDYNIDLYFGSIHPDTATDMIIEPEYPCDYVGSSAVAGDIDGDGIDDLVLSGIVNDGFFTGQVLGYCGGDSFDNHYDYFIDSGVSWLSLGSTLGLADVNGDSIAEVLAGAAQYEPPSYWGPGQVWFLTTQIIPSVPPLQVQMPATFTIIAYPNPFNLSTVLSFELRVASIVNLAVYDLAGRKVATLVDGWRSKGLHEVTFDASLLVSGVYICRLSTGDLHASTKIILLK
jgi:hypothetical protein